MSETSSSLGSSVGRKTSIAAGIALLIVGAPVLLMGLAAIVLVPFKDFDRVLAGSVTVFLVVGVFCVSTAIRMIVGRKRHDGGLLSPFVLRSAGAFFVLAPVLLMFDKGVDLRSIWRLLELGFCLAVAGGCFALASKRQHPVLSQDGIAGDE